MLRIFLWHLCMLISIACHTSAFANSVVFSRDSLTIRSVQQIPITKPSEGEEEVVAQITEPQEREQQLEEVIKEHEFIITIRNAESQSANWIYDATDVRGNFAILYVFDEAMPASIDPSANEYSYDIVAISSYGAVTALAKEIIAAELAEPISLPASKALLYLEGGTASRLGIKVGDTVQHELFPKKPQLEVQ